MSDTAVYLTLNGSPRHAFMAARCIESIRAFNSTIPIYLFSYGNPLREAERAARAASVTLVREAARPPEVGTYLKWLPLASMPERRALYLDADTVCLEDPIAFLERYTKRSFYARIECGTRARATYLIGTYPIYPILDRPALKSLRSALGARALPVLNTGVMVFNRRSHHAVAENIGVLFELQAAWATGVLPYPCTLPHVAEEIAASILLGMAPRLTLGAIAKKDSPWFIEHLAGEAATMGSILHIWSAFYPFFLERTRGGRARARVDALAHTAG